MSKQFIAAMTLASSALMVAEATACGEAPSNEDMKIKLSQIPHENVLTPEQIKYFGNGTVMIATAEGTTTEETGMRVRCMVPQSVEVTVNKAAFEAATADSDKIHFSYDMNYDEQPGQTRGCINVATIGKPPTTEGNDVVISFTLNETWEQAGRRSDLELIEDANGNKNNEAWCYTVRVDSVTLGM